MIQFTAKNQKNSANFELDYEIYTEAKKPNISCLHHELRAIEKSDLK